MAEKYRVIKTVPSIYLDKQNNAVQGYLVIFELTEFDEVHEIRLPKLTEKDVKNAIEQFIAEREKIAKL